MPKSIKQEFDLALTFEEALACVEGEDIEVYRESQRQRDRIRTIGDQYLRKPVKYWPSLQFNWDMRAESMRFAMDGVKQADFEKWHPQGFKLGWVKRRDFDKKLCYSSRRNGSRELWKLGSKSKLSFCIAYLAEGLPITPPLINPTVDGELVFGGGHHRYAVAKAVRLEVIPIYLEFHHAEAIAKIVPIKWSE